MLKGTVKENPYLAFSGNCREAMEFYKSAFDAELNLMTFKEQPGQVPVEMNDKIMHSSLTFGDVLIMASDTMPGQPFIQGTNNAIILNFTEAEDAENYFNRISNGGMVLMPFADTFWGAKFGMCSDKFGVYWMLNAEAKKD